jgi:hypothetical protein
MVNLSVASPATRPVVIGANEMAASRHPFAFMAFMAFMLGFSLLLNIQNGIAEA